MSTTSSVIAPRSLTPNAFNACDHVVGGLPGDVGGDFVALRVPRRVAVHHQVRDARIAGQRINHLVAQFAGCDDP